MEQLGHNTNCIHWQIDAQLKVRMLGLTLDGFIPLPSASFPRSFMTSVEGTINCVESIQGCVSYSKKVISSYKLHL